MSVTSTTNHFTNFGINAQVLPTDLSQQSAGLKQEVRNIFGENIHDFFTFENIYDEPVKSVSQERLFEILNGIACQRVRSIKSFKNLFRSKTL